MLSPGSLCFVCRRLGLFFALLIKINKHTQSYFLEAGFQCSSWAAVCVMAGGSGAGQDQPVQEPSTLGHPGTPRSSLPARLLGRGTRTRIAWLLLLHRTSMYGCGQGNGAATLARVRQG